MNSAVNGQFLTIEGHVGFEPMLRYTANGLKVANFTVGVNTQEVFADETGIHPKTEWYKVIAWDQAAEKVVEHITVGMPVRVAGKFQARAYRHPETGEDRISNEISLRDLDILERITYDNTPDVALVS